MPTLDDAFPMVHAALVAHYGPAVSDFEGRPAFESLVAAYLDRALGEAHGRPALAALIDDDLITPETLAAADIPRIIDALGEHKIAVTSRIVAPLKHLARWVVEHGGSGWSPGEAGATGRPMPSVEWLRDELGALKGIGPAAADALVLFALNRPSYPVDRASFRVMVRHGWLDPTATYAEARDLVVERAIDDTNASDEHAARVLGDLSHAMAQVGRQFCRAAAPHCERCPLAHLLPEGGPREGDA
jgi:endonuclease III